MTIFDGSDQEVVIDLTTDTVDFTGPTTEEILAYLEGPGGTLRDRLMRHAAATLIRALSSEEVSA